MTARSTIAILACALALAAGLFLLSGRDATRPPVADGAGPGGPFALVDHQGTPVTDTDFRGRYLLIYFGYGTCPDICPTELMKMSRALELAEADGVDLDRIVPLFITVDPERDTVAFLARYVGMFHPRLIGLTGTPEAIASAAKAYGIYFARAGEGDDYLMDHSSLILLMDRENRYLDFFSARESAEEIAATLATLP